MIRPTRIALSTAAGFSAAVLSVSACAPPERDGGDRSPTAGRVAVCPTDPPGGASLARIPRDGGHDASILGEMVLYETNRIRCDTGLAPLTADPVLARAAQAHARDMARLDFFDHRSPVGGRGAPEDRIRAAGGRRAGWRRTAENIIEANFVAYENGSRYRVVDAGACRFVDRHGRPLQRHSYASLAREIVRRWLKSPGHRANILNPGLRYHGAAMAPNRTPTLCGGLYAVQVFAG